MMDLFANIEKSAIVSSCKSYRYRLERRWNRRDSPIVWVMLNPSTADADIDDPTIRRCIRFSQAWGYGSMIVVNLFALRSTDPGQLAKAADPVGELNDEHLIFAAGNWPEMPGAPMVAAWGAHPFAAARAAHVLRIASSDWWCLGTTKDGHPRHPLYVPSATQLTAYEPPEI